MPHEIIGEAGDTSGERDWVVYQSELAIRYLKRVCGEPPPEMELEVRWEEHELGGYPVIALTWEDAMRGAPDEYIEKCQQALEDFDWK